MNTNTIQQQLPVNSILNGDCIQKMREMPANSVDFILTDPPYLVNFRDRTGRRLPNDTNANWLKPAMKEAYRVLKQNRLMLRFYG
jgi:DNA modification methylase